MNFLSETTPMNQAARPMAILRLVMACLSWSLLPLVSSLLDLPLPGIQLQIIFLIYLLFALTSLMRAAGQQQIVLLEWIIYWLIDYLLVGALIFITGGIRNPITAYFFVLLALTAFSLPKKWSWFFWVLTLVEYSVIAGLTFRHSDLIHHGGDEYYTHLIGMWLSFGLTSWLLCYFLTRALTLLRNNNTELTEIREKILRDDLAVMMGTLAATTAHTIATPLSSMSVILGDLAKETLTPELKQDVELLQSQVQHCKNAIQQMAEQAKDYQLNGEKTVSVIEFAKILQEDFHLLKPEVIPVIQLSALIKEKNPQIKTNPTLPKSILHFIDNAIAAQSQAISIIFDADEHWITITIQDNGQGIAEEALKQWGKSFNNRQKNGLGVGVFLSHVTIERLGGFIRVNQLSPQTEIQIFLPKVKNNE